MIHVCQVHPIELYPINATRATLEDLYTIKSKTGNLRIVFHSRLLL
jgi:hypothetical protein